MNGSDNTMEQLLQVARAFGMDLPKMATDRESLVRGIAEAKDEATAARHQNELDKLEMQFERLREGLEANQSDPVRTAVDQYTSNMILQKLQPSPVEQVFNDHMAAKLKKTLEGEDQPPGSIMGVMSTTIQNMKDLKELGAMFAPPAPAVVSHGLDPERQLDLDMRRLEMEERLEQRRQDKEAAVQEAKAASYAEVGKIVSTGIELIGKTLGAQMGIVSGGSTPESTQQTKVNPSSSETQTITCPSCQQPSIYVTPDMVKASDSRQIEVVCTSCGDHHTLGDASPDQDTPAAADENQVQRQRRERAEAREARAAGKRGKPNRNRIDPASGREIPRFVSQAGGPGGGWN